MQSKLKILRLGKEVNSISVADTALCTEKAFEFIIRMSLHYTFESLSKKK